MDVNEARKISMENGFEKKVEREIQNVENRIKRAAENGQTSTCAFNCDADKSDVEFEAKKYFLKRGFSFKPTGYCGGVWQRTEDICW